MDGMMKYKKYQDCNLVSANAAAEFCIWQTGSSKDKLRCLRPVQVLTSQSHSRYFTVFVAEIVYINTTEEMCSYHCPIRTCPPFCLTHDTEAAGNWSE